MTVHEQLRQLEHAAGEFLEEIREIKDRVERDFAKMGEAISQIYDRDK